MALIGDICSKYHRTGIKHNTRRERERSREAPRRGKRSIAYKIIKVLKKDGRHEDF